MTANCQGNKEVLDKVSGQWEGTTYYKKPLYDAEDKLAKLHWKKLSGLDHYQRSGCAVPSRFSVSCSWILSCGGWTWEILKN